MGNNYRGTVKHAVGKLVGVRIYLKTMLPMETSRSNVNEFLAFFE
jgi:hypothetical protein